MASRRCRRRATSCCVRPRRSRLRAARRDRTALEAASSATAAGAHARDAAAPPDAINRAAGRIAQTSFLGNILRHRVVIAGAPGVAMTVDVQNASAEALLAPQGEVTLS